MRRSLFVAAIAFCFSLAAFAQKKDALAGKEKMFTDTFKGQVQIDDTRFITGLILMHCRFCDMGKFILQEAIMDAMDKPSEIKGEWTVLKGDAVDENATVVEIDSKNDTLYLLRMKNGDLQKLDAQLREIKPVAKYMLRKR